MSNFQVLGRPNVKVRSIAAWDRTTALQYDELIANNADRFWPLGELATGPDYDYDELHLTHPDIANYYPLDELVPIVYGSYDVQMITDGANNHYPLDDIDTV